MKNVADYIADLLQPDKPDEYRPIIFYLSDIKDSIVKLTTCMLELDKQQREQLGDVIMTLSQIYKVLSDLNKVAK